MTIFILIISISFLILIHELGHFLAAKAFGRWVEEFGIGFPPRLFKKKIGETVYSVNALPFGGFVKIHGEQAREEGEIDPMKERSFAVLSVWRRIVIIGAGVVMNFFMGWFLLSIIFMVGIPRAVVVTDVVKGAPAALVGIERGDVVVGIERRDVVVRYDKGSDFTNFIQSSKGTEVTLIVKRGAQELKIKVTPRTVVPEGQGPLGVALADVGQEKLPLFASFGAGFTRSAEIIGEIFQSFGRIIVGVFHGAVTENFVGPVGIFGIANETAKFGFIYLLQLIGLISLNLTVLNILPIPALDGGRLLFLVIEKIKGSPISPKRENFVNAAGFVILILLMVAITVRDVVKLF